MPDMSTLPKLPVLVFKEKLEWSYEKWILPDVTNGSLLLVKSVHMRKKYYLRASDN